jgi:hypothetical protein
MHKLARLYLTPVITNGFGQSLPVRYKRVSLYIFLAQKQALTNEDMKFGELK